MWEKWETSHLSLVTIKVYLYQRNSIVIVSVNDLYVSCVCVCDLCIPLQVLCGEVLYDETVLLITLDFRQLLVVWILSKRRKGKRRIFVSDLKGNTFTGFYGGWGQGCGPTPLAENSGVCLLISIQMY